MKILELNLVSFGKFQNRIINFNTNFIVIEGKNESGKTTVFKFIEGVFYGFVKPYLRSQRLNNDFYKYKPWYSERYEGSIVFEFEGKIYRIFRDFNNKEYRIFNEELGVEISKELTGYEVSNLSFPGEFFFKCSSDIFLNSILINEKNEEIDTITIKYITDKLSEIITQGINNFSATSSINYLSTLKSNIGTEKATKKPFGILLQNQKNLTIEINETKKQKSDYDNLIIQIDSKQKEFIELKSKIKKFEEYELYLNSKSKLRLKKKLISIKDELLEINNELSSITKIHNLVANDIKDVEEILCEIDLIQKQFNDLSKEKKLIYGRYKELESMGIEENKKIEDIDKLYKMIRKINIFKKLIIVTIVFFLSSLLICSILNLNQTIFLVSGISFIFIFAIQILVIYFNNKTDIYLKIINKEYNLFLDKKNLKLEDKIIFNRLLSSKLSDVKSEIIKKDKDIEILLNDEDFKNEQLMDLSNIIKEKTGFSYEKHLENKNLINYLIKKLVDRNKELEFLTINYDIDEILNTEIIDFDVEFLKVQEFDIEKAREDTDLLIKEISYLEERKYSLEKYITRLPNLIEELDKINNDIGKIKDYLNALDIAIEEIIKASNEIKVSYLPKIVKFLQDYFFFITQYNLNIKLDENLNINVNKDDFSEYKTANALSMGTIDLLNMGLKIAIANEIFDKNEFIILDNSFNNLDDERVKKIYEFLKNLSDKRQVVIFTCQEREIKIAERIINVEFIEL